MKKELQPELLKTRKHFEILDGLRGVAALAIVVFHFMEWIFSDSSQNFIGHGFLAVDFFFCLSGFVIGYAYDSRIQAMGTLEFFKSRLIRLHPLVILGAVLGLAGFLLDPFSTAAGMYSPGRILLLFGCTLLLVPFPVMEDRSFNIFGLNAPAWSLFWEYVANIAYAVLLCRLRKRTLIILAVLSGVLLCLVSYRAGNLLGGWSKATFWDGGARVAYSFTVGLLLYRCNLIIRNRLGFAGLAVLLAAAFVMPCGSWNGVSESLVVLLYFPLLVALGAGAVLSEGSRKLCVFSGKLSYPLYMTHYWAIWIFGNYFLKHKPGGGQLAVIVVIGTLFLVGFATLVMVLYDIPVRRYLTRKREQGLKRGAPPAPEPSGKKSQE